MNWRRAFCWLGEHDYMKWATRASKAEGTVELITYRVRRCRRCGHNEQDTVRTPARRKRELAAVAKTPAPMTLADADKTYKART